MTDDDTQMRILNLLDVLSVQIGAAHERVDALHANVEGLRSNVEGLHMKFDDLRTETKQGFI